MALSGHNLLDITKSEEKKRELQKELRTPGLMKIEFQGGKEMIGLCSETYMVLEQNTGKVKYSLKGANKTVIDPSGKFRAALEIRESATVENRGIRLHENQLHTYTQTKYAFTYFYCKRKVLSDGIHTVPFDLTLTPIGQNKNKNLDDDDDDTYLISKHMNRRNIS
ncbi:hypothetical protein KUTeg_010500 [Tegillarca granosa]|uniref:Uncharacterized protein n=1 Tax=Tegillarca granosa TaxID=220873 RepID=A0ABQ9F3H5_TEGGR|nr:hypothetical protein KUTeg_010500 [Tegillarca granosa]